MAMLMSNSRGTHLIFLRRGSKTNKTSNAWIVPQGNSFYGAPCAKQKEGGKAETRVTVRAKLNSNRRRLSNKSSRGVSRGIRREKGGREAGIVC